MSDFKILTDLEHVKMRPNMYIGSVANEPHERFLFGKVQTINYVPGLVKIIDEIIDNSVDEAIRTNFEFANQIDVSFDGNIITVADNGRGIPQHMVTTPEGTQIPQPVAAWTRTKAGSNFDDTKRVSMGMNGVGAALTNAFSEWFVGDTCNNENTITVSCTDGANNVSWKSSPGGKRGTMVKFSPDFQYFDGILTIDSIIHDITQDRLNALSVVFPQITFKLNGKRIQFKKFKKYVELYSEESVVTESDDYSIAICSSSDGFRQVSYVNGLHIKNGGSHVEWLLDSIGTYMVTAIKKQYKIDITKARIKESLTLLMIVRNMPNLKFDSQTKERLTNTWGDVKSHIDVDTDKLAKQIMKNESILMPIIESALARKLAAEQAAVTKAEKKAAKAKVAKHIKAGAYDSQADTTLFLTEGDSATGYFLKVRDPKLHGCYSLRGKIVNTWGAPEAEIIKNKEIADIMAILGLTFKASPFNMKSDGAFYEIEVNGETVVANINDEIFVDGKWVEVSEIVKGK